MSFRKSPSNADLAHSHTEIDADAVIASMLPYRIVHLPQSGGGENTPMRNTRGHVSHSLSEPEYGQKLTDAFQHLILRREI